MPNDGKTPQQPEDPDSTQAMAVPATQDPDSTQAMAAIDDSETEVPEAKPAPEAKPRAADETAPMPVAPPPTPAKAPAPRRVTPPPTPRPQAIPTAPTQPIRRVSPPAAKTPPPPPTPAPAPAPAVQSAPTPPLPPPPPIPAPRPPVVQKPPPPPAAKPQRVLPTEPPPRQKKGGKKLLVFVALVLLAAAVVAGVWVTRSNDSSKSTEAQVKESIELFGHALTTGDIQTLRRTTCGPFGDYYKQISDERFAEVYKAEVDQKSIPVVQSVGRVSVTDDTAIAEVTVFRKADPSNRLTRTLNLMNVDDTWKVCEPPA